MMFAFTSDDVLTYASWLEVVLNHLEVVFMIATGVAFVYLAGGVFPKAITAVLGPNGITFAAKIRAMFICKTSRVAQRLFIEYAIVKSQGEVLSKKEWSDLLSEFSIFFSKVGDVEEAEIGIDNCMDITTTGFSDTVERYFNYLSLPRVDSFYSISRSENYWISQIKIEEAYVMPAVLLSGLLARYQDNWQTFIARYISAATTGSNAGKRKVVMRELYNVFAWLLWGPSREISWEDGWDGLCQISYGDESNSLSSYLSGEGDVIGRMRSIFLEQKNEGTFGALFDVNIDLEPKKLFFKKHRNRLLTSNSYFSDKIAKDTDTPFVAHIVDFQPISDYRSTHYYCTAYIWVLFELDGAEDHKFHPENSVALFEHANLANKDTGKFLAETLLNKAVTHFKMVQEDPENSGRKYRFVCGCNRYIENQCKEKFLNEIKKGGEFGNWLSEHVSFDVQHDPNSVFEMIDNYFGDHDSEITYEDVTPEDRVAMADFSVFYAGMYTKAFPDDNERESLVNFIAYLKRSVTTPDWTYHILLAKDDQGVVIGGAIFNYFAKSNAVVVEFIVVDEQQRSKHLGSRLFDQILEVGDKDARAHGKKGLEYAFCEVESPEAAKNGVGHLHFWDTNWMKRLNFEYVQPALSSDQEPVTGLWFVCRSRTKKDIVSLPSSLVKSVVYDYVNYSMSVEDPMKNKDYAAMDAQLSAVKDVALLPIWNKEMKKA